MDIPENEKMIIKEKATFLIDKGYKLSEGEFLKYTLKDVTIQIAYSFQEGNIGIFFEKPFSFFSVGWLFYYLEKDIFTDFIREKRGKVEYVLFELEFLKNNLDNLTKYSFCKKIDDESNRH